MTQFILCTLSAALVVVLLVYVLPWAVPKVLQSKWWKRFWGGLIPLTLIPLTLFAAGPRIENLNIRHESNGCIFAEFNLSADGEPGNYYLMWSSPEFILPNYWIPVTRIEYDGGASYTVPLYTNFTCCQLRLEKIQ